MSKPMNFIIFNPDEWRGDYAGCYGHPVVQTPHLDRLAAEGTRFDQAFVQHTVCTPSRCSFMTGWYPHVRGHRSLWHCLRPDEPNLLRYLKQAGYEVAMFGKNDLLAQDCFADSVTFHDHPQGSGPRHSGRTVADDKPGFFSFLHEAAPGGIDDHPDAACVQAGIDFLQRDHQQPFCLYLPIIQPHCPYVAPQPYHDRYDPDSLPPLRPICDNDKPMYHRRIRETRNLLDVPESHFKKLNAVYLGMISVVDDLLGQLLRSLDEAGLADSTCVIVFSDHGDWAGDYGLVEKWSSCLDDTLTRVPFIIRMPGGTAGHVVSEQVEIFDQMATVLELAGIEAEHTHFARSLVPQLKGATGDPDRAVFAEGGYDSFEPECFEGESSRDSWAMHNTNSIYYPKLALQQSDPLSVCRSSMIRTSTHKLVRRPATNEHELYDLQADPLETVNRYHDPNYAGIRTELTERLCDWYVQTSDVTPHNDDPRGMPPVAASWPRRGVSPY